MLLVNNPGTWSAVWWPLDHAEWHGWTPTDLIFPFFLFVVGITTELSRKEPKAILRRGAFIILFGLLLNAFPFYWWGKMPDPTLLERVAWRIDHLRFLGVLQRIGIVYIVAALIAWGVDKSSSRRVDQENLDDTTTRRLGDSRLAILAIAVVILLTYWFVLTRGPLAPPSDTIAARVDRAVLGLKHVWSISETWDPEGPLSTIPAVATALLGIAAAPWVRARNVRMLTIGGAIGLALGWCWGLVFPINKNLWTSSYVVFTAGFACVLLALFIWIIDIRGAKKWATPFVIFGVNPLVAFVGSGLMARLLGLIKIDGTSLQALSYQTFFQPYFEPHVGSFLWGMSFVLVWLAILWAMYRRGIVLKV